MTIRKLPYCDVDHHPPADTPGVSGHLYKTTLRDLTAKVSELEAENAALIAQLGENALPRAERGGDTEPGDVLVALAEAFLVGHAFAHPGLNGQSPDDVKTGRQPPHSMEPTGGMRAARTAVRELVRGVESRIQRFHNRRENDFRTPSTLRDVQQPCDWCGEGFVAMRASAKFCSDACRQRHSRASRDSLRDSDELQESTG